MKRRMKRSLILLAVALIAVSIVRGWVGMTAPQRENQTNKVDVKITVDPDKVKEDARHVKESAETLENKVRDEFKEVTK
jgi:hypothetical protein